LGRPYVRAYQNRLETILFGLNIVVIALACAYSEIIVNEDTAAAVAVEIALVVTLASGMAMGVYFIFTSSRPATDLTSLLRDGTLAEKRIDTNVLEKRLGDGSILLLSCRWLLSPQLPRSTEDNEIFQRGL